MQAIRDRYIRGDKRFGITDLYWAENMYLFVRLLLIVGTGSDHATVEKFLLQAETAGLIKDADAKMIAMAMHLELREGLHVVRGAWYWSEDAAGHRRCI